MRAAVTAWRKGSRLWRALALASWRVNRAASSPQLHLQQKFLPVHSIVGETRSELHSNRLLAAVEGLTKKLMTNKTFPETLSRQKNMRKKN